MSSHREAPEIAKDPVADNTDVYAFVSPQRPKSVTLIANFIPLQKPDGGPNFYEFGEDVLYEIHVSNKGTAKADISYQFRFHTKIRNDKTFLYNIGPISDIKDPNWNRPQFYDVVRVKNGKRKVIAENLRCAPVNIGPRSTPDYPKLANQSVHRMVGGRKVFAGQRAEGFHVDLGSIFDLGTLRPFQSLHLIPTADAMGVNATKTFNVHSIALQVPIKEVTRGKGRPTDPMSKRAVIGVWATASRRKSRMLDPETGRTVGHGPWQQVSRLGNPLFNEVITPMAEKDEWNFRAPDGDQRYEKYVNKPELAKLLPALYPGVFPNLAKYTKPRADLHAVLLTGIPEGVVDGFQNFTGPVPSDMLRLNVAIPPSAEPNKLGLVAGDAAGFPNGRRVTDDVTTIELRAIAGVTIPLVDPSFTPDKAAAGIEDGTTNDNPAYLNGFPYLGNPNGGYQTTPGDSAVS
ncbi:DUF4331 domain-containing protein [Nocardioides iriomotensis]|uniref:DUF4331 domain-containing protein n=1 Tax=Nocardioides iriomotensis TaxID=715784 RepID=A0A4Q5IWI2_9ACTN|nr:DUF4331 domain-containing protein [Nocardioides iriomotensis]RYU09275.1 DUF4331 domain-containing protein [Nocardioides iriomotensis]